MHNVKTQNNKYGLVRKANHWIVALMFISLLTVGFYMHDLPGSNPQKWELYALHKSFGVIIMLFIFIRIIWLKFDNKIDNSKLTKLERVGSASLHGFLYLLMLIMPISGMFMSMFGGHKVKIFDIVTLPMLVEKNKDLSSIMYFIHSYAGKLAVALIVVHVLASVYHHFIKKDDILRRMV